MGTTTSGSRKFSLTLPAGKWEAGWLTPRYGQTSKSAPFDHPGGPWQAETPSFTEDLALRLRLISS